MKLINKSIGYYLLFSLPLLLLVGFLAYFFIQKEIEDSTKEWLKKETSNAQNIITSLNQPQTISLSQNGLSKITLTQNNNSVEQYLDTIVFDEIEEENITFHLLKTTYTNGSNNYLITVAKASEEEEELLNSMLGIFIGIILLIIAAFFLINWFLSKSIWKPFYKTLDALHQFDIKSGKPIALDSSSIVEFSELSQALNKMTEKAYSDFVLQKEFTENASHELQTPLAVIKANISLLMQSPNLKEEEMGQLQVLENTVKKLSALNKTLLLLTKIENHQFGDEQNVNLKGLISKIIQDYSDHIASKKIQVEEIIDQQVTIKMNIQLAEILFSNLIQNAVRHSNEAGKIKILANQEEIIISNTGNPLTINEQDLFVRFKKNDASQESLGLGLSLVKSIVDNFGFTISYSYFEHMHVFKLKIQS